MLGVLVVSILRLVKFSCVGIYRAHEPYLPTHHCTSALNSPFSEVVSSFSTDAMPRRRHKVSPIHKCWRSAGTGGRGDKEKGGQRGGREGKRGRGERGAGRSVAEGERGGWSYHLVDSLVRLIFTIWSVPIQHAPLPTHIPIVFLIFDHVTFKIKH